MRMLNKSMATLKERFDRCVRAMIPAAGEAVADTTCMETVVKSRGYRMKTRRAKRTSNRSSLSRHNSRVSRVNQRNQHQ
jgi:hypothetical protein